MNTSAAVVIAFVLAAGLGGVRPESPPATPVPPAPPAALVEVTATDENLGKVPAGTIATRRVKFRNAGTTTLHLRVITTSCGCMEARVEPASVEPGELCSVTIAIRALPAGGQQQHYAEIGARIAPDGADVQKSIVSVVYEPNVTFLARPDTLAWTVFEGEPLASHLMLRSEEGPEVFDEPLRVKVTGVPDLVCSPAHALPGLDLLRRIEIQARFSRPGLHCGHIAVDSSEGSIIVPVVARVLPAWRAEPAGVVFASMENGPREIALVARTSAAVALAAVTLADPDTPVEASLASVNGVPRVSVRLLRPPQPSELGSTLLNVRDAAGDIRLAIPVVWWGSGKD